jgi:hypothetical protein
MSSVLTHQTFYETKVKSIQHAIRDHLIEINNGGENGHSFSLKKTTVSHRVPQLNDFRKNTRKIDITSFNNIIEIDSLNRICIAESGVTFAELVKETLKHGLIPTVVPELKTITLGGAIAGCSIESMSFKYEGFHNSCLEYEIITGTGEIITCSPTHREDIFEMIHNSFGTLGILTRLKFKLIPAKPFVRMEYINYSSFKEFMQAIMQHYKAQDMDFMDGIVHSPTECVLCLGYLTDSAPYVHTYDWNIFYKSTKKRKEDYLPIYDYLFRYDRECHWLTRNYGLENKLLRFLFGKFFLGSNNILKLAHKFPFLNYSIHGPKVVADVFIPASNSENFFDWYAGMFNFFPLWIVPYHINKMYPWINPSLMKDVKDTLFIDCAIYGFTQDKRYNYYKELENKVFSLKGIKSLITNNFYNEEEFWLSYNKVMYKKVKSKTDPYYIFGDLYIKTKAR